MSAAVTGGPATSCLSIPLRANDSSGARSSSSGLKSDSLDRDIGLQIQWTKVFWPAISGAKMDLVPRFASSLFVSVRHSVPLGARLSPFAVEVRQRSLTRKNAF